jgi:hypothetical protein
MVWYYFIGATLDFCVPYNNLHIDTTPTQPSLYMDDKYNTHSIHYLFFIRPGSKWFSTTHSYSQYMFTPILWNLLWTSPWYNYLDKIYYLAYWIFDKVKTQMKWIKQTGGINHLVIQIVLFLGYLMLGESNLMNGGEFVMWLRALLVGFSSETIIFNECAPFYGLAGLPLDYTFNVAIV